MQMERAKAHKLINSLRADQDQAIILAINAEDIRLRALYSDLYIAATSMIYQLERDIDNDTTN